MEFPDALRYSAEHEWVAVDGTKARIGITDFAQDALGRRRLRVSPRRGRDRRRERCLR